MSILKEWYEKNKKTLLFAMAATYLWGFVTHGYAFFDNSFTWDSLSELNASIYGNNLRMYSGRYLVPLYRDLLRSNVTLPWLIGLLSLFWIGLAVFLILRIFKVESKAIAFLIAGVFVTNTTISATAATYIHDLDCFTVSLLCAVSAVYLWQTLPRGWLWGAPLIAISLGMYQSYVFTAAALVMIVSILALMNGIDFSSVFRKGLCAVVMVLLGGGLYYIGLKTIVPLSGIRLSSGNYNSMDLILQITPKEIPSLFGSAYQDFFHRMWGLGSAYPAFLVRLIQLALAAVLVTAVMVWLWDRRAGWKEKVLCLTLLILLPLVMNMLKVLTLGMNHDLMVFAIWLTYLLILLLADWLAKKWRTGKVLTFWGQSQRGLCLLLTAVLMYGNVQLANGMYLKKDLEYDAYLSLMSRVTARMEEYDAYIPGQTPVAFVGTPENLNRVMPGFTDYWCVIGMDFSDVIHSPERIRFQAYFDYVMGLPIVLVDESLWQAAQKSELAQQKPSYPAKDCIWMQDGILMVKLGQPWLSSESE